MDIQVSNNNGQPIYEQIFQQIKAQIVSGILAEGTALPSMRLLAKELRISVITTKRAYEELERAGYIISMTGKGSFVAGINAELMREEQLQKIEGYLQQAVEAARVCNLSLEELQEMLQLIGGGEQENV
ncbi:MAG: GntR family transcriptional regulator [Peptococcaceae bacterium]|nr:GntR family transcriptional regulator [Peptococcaceae bacterium]